MPEYIRKDGSKSKQVGWLLPNDFLQELKALADSEERSVAWMAKKLIQEGLAARKVATK
jgi:hypothetical protein